MLIDESLNKEEVNYTDNTILRGSFKFNKEKMNITSVYAQKLTNQRSNEKTSLTPCKK